MHLACNCVAEGSTSHEPSANPNHGNVLLSADRNGLLCSTILMLDIMKAVGDPETV